MGLEFVLPTIIKLLPVQWLVRNGIREVWVIVIGGSGPCIKTIRKPMKERPKFCRKH